MSQAELPRRDSPEDFGLVKIWARVSGLTAAPIAQLVTATVEQVLALGPEANPQLDEMRKQDEVQRLQEMRYIPPNQKTRLDNEKTQGRGPSSERIGEEWSLGQRDKLLGNRQNLQQYEFLNPRLPDNFTNLGFLNKHNLNARITTTTLPDPQLFPTITLHNPQLLMPREEIPRAPRPEHLNVCPELNNLHPGIPVAIIKPRMRSTCGK
ncbi:pentatricopeptide repeat-containing protein mitochondrial-like [Dorcoceras hygrometricum]|uniref:Pentatricopeptide repeat-containing protein mitochondrial-like n=1 Tax=Dorcoceras hygrometricum TaxID=472368 RepID=A0A2Z7DCQ8_9LAMI|nr:pentatricopeptide repeat-containing protein mitochondrial-like [Dorcoceras hygrometricum]